MQPLGLQAVQNKDQHGDEDRRLLERYSQRLRKVIRGTGFVMGSDPSCEHTCLMKTRDAARKHAFGKGSNEELRLKLGMEAKSKWFVEMEEVVYLRN